MSETRRTSSRLASKVARDTVDWDAQWTSFRASTFRPGFHTSSSSEDCAAKLYFRFGGLIRAASGSTGSGHAEMDALKKVIILCEYDTDIFRELIGYGVEVECTEKPCCYRCSCILGALGIVANDGTRKSSSSMGSTQWGGLGPEERDFIELYLGIKSGSIEALAR